MTATTDTTTGKPFGPATRRPLLLHTDFGDTGRPERTRNAA
jgi:hypothetical protein